MVNSRVVHSLDSCVNDLFKVKIVQSNQNRIRDELSVRKGRSAHLQGNAVGVEIYFPWYGVHNRRRCRRPFGVAVEIVA